MKTVKTKYGIIQGVVENGYTIFKGIPYAKPPIRELRFKSPKEPEGWNGVYYADTFPPACMQTAPA